MPRIRLVNKTQELAWDDEVSASLFLMFSLAYSIGLGEMAPAAILNLLYKAVLK